MLHPGILTFLAPHSSNCLNTLYTPSVTLTLWVTLS